MELRSNSHGTSAPLLGRDSADRVPKLVLCERASAPSTVSFAPCESGFTLWSDRASTSYTGNALLISTLKYFKMCFCDYFPGIYQVYLLFTHMNAEYGIFLEWLWFHSNVPIILNLTSELPLLYIKSVSVVSSQIQTSL